MKHSSRPNSFVSLNVLLIILIATWHQASGLPRWLQRFQKHKDDRVDDHPTETEAVMDADAPPKFTFAAIGTTLTAHLKFLLTQPWYVYWIAFICGVILSGALYYAYRLGLFDRPAFRWRESVFWSSRLDVADNAAYWQKHDASTEYLYAIMAVSHDPNYGRVMARLLPATSQAVGAVVPPGVPETAALRYGAPAGANACSVALYLDDSNETRFPRWAVGWLVDASTLKQVQAWVALAQHRNAWDQPEPLKAVRLGHGPVLVARIPWRHVLTPALAPWLHWTRGFRTLGRPDGPRPLCAEFFVTGPTTQAGTPTREYMDYVLFGGDVSHTWRDLGFD